MRWLAPRAFPKNTKNVVEEEPYKGTITSLGPDQLEDSLEKGMRMAYERDIYFKEIQAVKAKQREENSRLVQQ